MAGSPFVAHDADFAGVLGSDAQLFRLADVNAHEGPVYLESDDSLYFTSGPTGAVPTAAIKRIPLGSWPGPFDVEVVTAATEGANGMAAAPRGGLYVCEQGSAAKPARI